MISPHHHKIRNNSPLLHKIREKGYTPVDMHIHTQHSDASISITSLLARAKHLGIGIAITDHNEIQGVIEASSFNPLVRWSSRALNSAHVKVHIFSFIFILRETSPIISQLISKEH